MYKALIVDDEKMIRNGIRRMIPWESIGVGEVFTADNGEEALEAIARERPDILLTDICMTEMDGLSLIERVNELHPPMRIIVLTGYDNFEYVQRCCRMDVQDFILKPADEEELSKVIRAQVEQLDKLRGIERYQKVMRRAQGVAEQLRLEQALRGLIYGRNRAEELGELFEEYQYRAGQPMQAVIVVPTLESDIHWREHADLLAMSVKNTCIELFDSAHEGITFEDDDGQIVIALFLGSTYEEPVERMEKLGSLLRNEFEFSPRIVMGSTAAGFSGLPVSYHDALHLLREAAPYREVVQSGSAERRLAVFGEAFNELKRVIVSSTDSLEKTLRAFSAFTTTVESYNLSVSMVRRCCFDIACALYYNYVCDTGENVDNKLSALLDSLMVCGREEACKFTRGFLEQLFGQDDAQSHDIISSAKQHINENLAGDLSVSSIASMLYVTPNYFSRLFKRVTGEGCNEYIVRKRMEMAKSLLVTTSFRTGKIAGMVGYRDTNYFSLAFKKHCGCSPTMYRDSKR